MKIAIAQINLLVGDLSGNADKMIDILASFDEDNCPDVVVYPELALCGYPPEDLLLRPDLHAMVDLQLLRIANRCNGCHALVGHPELNGGKLYNSVSLLADGQIIARYRKECLPNYQVFDEKRYFVGNDEPCVVEISGLQVGLLICEDLWFTEPIAKAKAAGAEIILSPNASPYHMGQDNVRLEVLAGTCSRTRNPNRLC